ncbi:immune-associated nucleotide-binding protein 9 [Biomphalaria pfeifferi]|uniref:Immune-associated nucleotide-binding protein 9 n=1 Tax=Biomphalaria pfeifferi TaxID=112525 RepID=A0AAD8F053_BIOPF|nr:immune-associated nucleotide-binding protein 9 [Biomphalaria pfeifferi]
MVLKLCRGGLHAFLIVISALGGFTNEDGTVLKYLKTIFGSQELIDHGVLVFIHGETLRMSLKDWCNGHREELKLKDIGNELSNRAVFISNEQDRERYRDEILQKVTQLKSVTNSLQIGRL